MMRASWWRVVLSGALVLASGCGDKPSGTPLDPTNARTRLEEVGEVYRVYSAGHGKPPESLKDLGAEREVGPAGVHALEIGDVLLNYGVAMSDTNDGPAATPSDKVLAYEKKAPESGGTVLMLDRTIKTMTADEFKAAPKASK